MKVLSTRTIAGLAFGAGLCSLASAGDVLVTADITTSTTWTADNVYNLQNQIFVTPGATLTIEAGTVISSDVTANGGGALAVSAGGQIFIQGTQTAPVIMTSKNDEATWTAGDPSTGTYREAANEWGNLTVMGNAYISEDAVPGNTATPSATNVAPMEGLVAAFPGDTSVLYGGGDDDDDSGSISHLSLRYGGRVIGLNNELNGLSLGGIGRGTDLSYIEVMNNVDDGIEIWGGTLELDHFSIWNVGDDSLDIDQGFRGKVQFGLIVQGFSLNAPQGSGVGDNCVETDGAEDSDYQPVTTTTMYNLTIIGQPVDGDGATTWRDGARVQYRNCIIMNCGEKVIRDDGDDGDGASGYGHNGTLSFADCWTTAFSVTSPVNAPANPADFYQTQTSGFLCEISDSVLFQNLSSSAYTVFDSLDQNDPSKNNVIEPANSPIVDIVRGAPVVKGTKVMLPVLSLDPRPANDALTSVSAAPADGFFCPAQYRGAFEPGLNHTWLTGWTASEAFGLTPSPAGPADISTSCPGSVHYQGSVATLSANLGGPLSGLHLESQGGPTNEFGFLLVSAGSSLNLPVFQGTFCLDGPQGRYNPTIATNQGLPQLNSIGQYGADGVFQSITGNSTCGSGFDVPVELPFTPAGQAITAGDTWHFQLWYRDQDGGGAPSANFTNVVTVQFP